MKDLKNYSRKYIIKEGEDEKEDGKREKEREIGTVSGVNEPFQGDN